MMLKIDDAVFKKFDSATIGAIKFNVSDMNTAKISKIIGDVKDNAVADFLKRYGDAEINDIPQVKLWLNIFEVMNVKKGKDSSIVFLSDYVRKNKNLFTISPIIDFYNSISLKYGIPMGGYNAARFEGDIQLRLARKGEEFCRINSKDIEKTSANEIVYADNLGVFCRFWNHKDSNRTKIDNDTGDVLFIFDGIDQRCEIEKAFSEICDVLSVSDYSSNIADKSNSSVEI
jgi:DNA/RNA-binding domain of Phe-tRNA-synthetase-like protein